MPDNKKPSSHIGIGMLAGAALGVAAATFLQSKRGKTMTRDLQKKVRALQRKVNAEIRKAGDLTKDRYQDIVDNIVEYYVKTKDIAKTEIPAVRKNLMDSWKTIEKELRARGR